ncbi:MAG TPA: two-component regulator propeller domain-containing protein, partial [Gemmataceae bacterium]|nr:two-component regulator propeller domain-containing protein [Gemmataceae bacterium]
MIQGEIFGMSWRNATSASLLGFGLIFALNERAAALDPLRAVSQYGHKTWTDRTGLPGQAVYDITQAQDGYLYLRTGSRLVRFDGAQFTAIDLRLGNQLIHESAKAIRRGSDNQLLIRTANRTLRFQNGRFVEALESGLVPEGAARAIFETRDRRLWVGSDCALYSAQGGPLKLAARDTGLVYAFVQNDAGDFWVGASIGLFQFRDGNLVHGPEHFAGIKDVRSLAMDWQQNLWIGTSTGLYRLAKGQAPEPVRAPAIEGQEITALTADMQNNMWIGTGKAGLMRVRNQQWQMLTAADGLSSNAILSLYEDREGSLWVGTSGGLDQLRDTKFVTYTTREGLPHDNTY